jgi:hypothetical protein
MGPRLWPAFAGIIMVEARKELMGALPAKAKTRRATQLAPAEGALKRNGSQKIQSATPLSSRSNDLAGSIAADARCHTAPPRAARAVPT